MRQVRLLSLAVVAFAAIGLAGGAQAKTQNDTLVVRAPGVVDYHCSVEIDARAAHHPSVVIDRDGDSGNISLEEADLYAAMYVRSFCQPLEDSIQWGSAPTWHSSNITHTGLVGPVTSTDGATVRLAGTARFSPPTQRVSSISFDTWAPSDAHWPDSVPYIGEMPHNVTLVLPAQWELRSIFGAHWTYTAPNAGSGPVTDSRVTFLVLSPHEFPRDDWSAIIGTSSITLLAAAVAALGWRRKHHATNSKAPAALPADSPFDE